MCSEKIYIFRMSELGIFFSNSANKWPDSVKIASNIHNGNVKKKQKILWEKVKFRKNWVALKVKP